jgi:hypothetical protein
MAAMRKVYRTWCELGRETSGRQPFWLQLNSSCWDEEKLNYEYCKDSYKRNKAVIERKFWKRDYSMIHTVPESKYTCASGPRAVMSSTPLAGEY